MGRLFEYLNFYGRDSSVTVSSKVKNSFVLFYRGLGCVFSILFSVVAGRGVSDHYDNAFSCYTLRMQKKEGKVYRVLSQIETSLEKQNSTWRVFVQGLVRGLGTAIGATVVLAIVTSLTIQLTDSIDIQAFLGYFVESTLSE